MHLFNKASHRVGAFSYGAWGQLILLEVRMKIPRYHEVMEEVEVGILRIKFFDELPQLCMLPQGPPLPSCHCLYNLRRCTLELLGSLDMVTFLEEFLCVLQEFTV